MLGEYRRKGASPQPRSYNCEMATRNNVTRFLESHRVRFLAFDLPAEKLGARETAELLHVRPEIVFKTIVVKRAGTRKPLLVLIPGSGVADLKLVAAAANERKVFLPTEREAEALTGLRAGGISPLALINRGFQVLVDSSAAELDEIHISGGERGLNIRLPVADLMNLTQARFANVTRFDNSG